MISALLRLFAIITFIFFLSGPLSAQNGFNTGLNGTVINLACSENCVTRPFRIPHLKSSSDYSINTIGYTPFAYSTPTGNEITEVYADDQYSALINMPFSFCFYDSIYTKAVVGSNGVLTFDETNASPPDCGNSWQISETIPYAGGAQCDINAPYYPKASIMGVFTDLDPQVASSPADRKIEWRFEGTAPFRRLIVSFYHLGVFGVPGCSIPAPTTFQIVVYESTGLIEVFIENKTCFSNFAPGDNAILGIQNWARNRAVAAPGKNATRWSEHNTAYRFTPSGSVSRFVSCQLQTLAGAPVVAGDTVTTTAGLLDVTFPGFCPTATTGQYVIKTTYTVCDNVNSQIVILDTITVNKTTALNATAALTTTNCGVTGTGTATITVPAGTGIAPYTYLLTPGNISQATNQFNGLTAGNYTVSVTDASGGCSSILPITIVSTGVLTVTYNVINTSCAGASNGSITVNPPNGTPPITYSINGGLYTTNNIFSNLAPGTYSISTLDNAGCSKQLDPVTVLQGTGTVTGTAAAAPTACTGVNNGSITITPTSGTGPYQYSLNGGPYQTSNVFTGLAAGNYTATIKEAGLCISAPIPVTVNPGSALLANAVAANTSCSGATNATITVTPTNGTAPYTFTLDGTVIQNGTATVFAGIAAGVHSVVVSDASGCQSAPIPVTVIAGPVLTGTATATATSCPGVNNGTITGTATNGTGPYTYSLDAGAPQAANVFTNVSAGAHTIIIRNALGCASANIPVTVTSGTGLTATLTPTSTTCTGVNNGTIAVTPTNGTAPYTFVLDGTTTQAGAAANYTGVATGNHTVAITDAIGCTTVTPLPVTVTAGGGFTATFTSTNSSCTGATNGSITITTGTGGTGPYTFVLDGTTTQTGATNTIFNNIASGTHTVVITDANGCQFTLNNANVTANTGFTATFTSTNSTCTGATNGSITVTVGTGGTGPYTFVLDGATTQTGATNTIFNNIASGTHTVVITDANGCRFTLNNANVTASAGFTATFTSTNSSCTGATNGSITVTTGTGGTGPYTFVLDGATTQTGATNTTFANLLSGTHSVFITDANGCQFTLNNANVTASAGFTATFTSTNSSCTGATNGSITVTTGAGGTGPYTFVLDGVTTQTAAANTTFTNLASGTHTVLITDANGCQFTLNNANVTASAGFTATYTSVATSCSGAANGSITVTPGTGGTAPYTFVLDGATTQTGATNAVFTNLASGTHNVLITDANGCQFTLNNANVTAGAALAAVVTPVATACPGVNNGSITVTPSNGNGPYIFVLDGTITQTGATTTTYTGIAAGSHTIVVTDVNGCNSTLPLVNVVSGTGVTGNVNPTGTSCTGATNGSIAITPTNGTSPYTFVLNGTTTQTGVTTTSFAGLAAGATYSIVVTDAIGCTGTFSNINVAQGSALLANAVAAPTTCNGAANGQITITPANGAGPYTFVLNGTTTQTGATNSSFTGLIASTYSIVVTDAAGCISSPVSATINPGAAITITPVKVDATCFGATTGSITATASANATAPVEFSLNNITWQTSPNFNGLAANTYTVYIRDAVGCTNTAMITVGHPAQLVAATTVKNVLCNGQNNGVITVNATGGTSAYSYSLDNITFQPGNTFSVGAGPYIIYVRDVNNCQVQVNNVNVTQPAALAATTITGNATCDGGNDGTITVTPTGGTLPYQYSTNGTNFQSSGILNVAPGTFNSVTVKDANGCTFIIPAVTVGLTNNLTLTPAADPAPVCEGNSIQLQLTTNATQFVWTPATGLSSSTIANPQARPATTTLYSVIATLGRCSLPDDILVTILPAPIPDAGIDGDICYGQNYQLRAVGNPTYTYTWSPATYLGTTTGITTISTPDKTTIYALDVTDINGCTSLKSDQVTVFVTPPIQVTTNPADTVVYAGAQVPLLATSAGTSYLWSPVAGLDNPNIPNPVATAPVIEGAVVIYKVTTTTTAGCQGEGFITIRVYKGPEIYVATGFTPNGDGKNDVFIPFPVGIKKLNYFRVYNRWGQLLYSTTTLNQGWDGRFGGMEQGSGAYVWMAEAVTMDNKIISKKGSVILIR